MPVLDAYFSTTPKKESSDTRSYAFSLAESRQGVIGDI
jgi:hypothetical protein